MRCYARKTAEARMETPRNEPADTYSEKFNLFKIFSLCRSLFQPQIKSASICGSFPSGLKPQASSLRGSSPRLKSESLQARRVAPGDPQVSSLRPFPSEVFRSFSLACG